MKKVVLLMVFVLILGTTPAWAICGSIDQWIDDQANSDSYVSQLSGGILKGVHQVVESPVYLLQGAYDGTANAEPSLLCPKGEVPGFLMGFVKGAGVGGYDLLENVTAGVGNIVYALLPNVGPIGDPNEEAAE